MSLRSITIKFRTVIFAATATAFFGAPAVGQNVIEKLVSPGDLSRVHAIPEATCDSCHASFNKGAQNGLCLECHKEIALDVRARKGFHGKAPDAATASCSFCHAEHKGRAAQIAPFDKTAFNHRLTDYPLMGGHLGVACAECHAADAKYRDAPTSCVSCHADSDPHKGALGTACADCHVVADWRNVEFDHSKTKFPLKGKHQTAQCDACHADKTFQGASTACIDCHRSDDAHEGAFGADCESCHSPSAWTEIVFDHGARTRFALVGRHATIACAACHTGTLVVPKLKTACASCHAKDDVHKGRNGADCASCHDAFAWTSVKFDHDRRTKFRLRGAHRGVGCESCHLEPVTKSLPGRACVDCHRDDDPHKGGQGPACETCHNESSWTASVKFDHDLTVFPLLGKHKTAECDDCHQSREFSETSTDCVSCHLEDDAHAGALGANCGLCHNPNDWAYWRFDHDAETDFALTGAHQGLKCAACHRDASKGEVRVSSACISCHRRDDRHHGQYGASCERCHTTTSFSEIKMP
ncbi:MAG: cytochrome C [Parvularculaceae bacterium]|nr:cytochrome C [Parvularculaceae bacterium]